MKIKLRYLLLLLPIFYGMPRAASAASALSFADISRSKLSVLVLYDGADMDTNPGKLDAMYLVNLLGHFTTHRALMSVEAYKAGEMKKFDAVFCIVYQKKYRIPAAMLEDAAATTRPFCWLGNQVGQLDRTRMLSKRGIKFERFFEDSPARQVTYKDRTLGKGDPDTNILSVDDSGRSDVVAEAIGAGDWKTPYVIRSGSFWIVADSPFSYSSENDRYFVFADILHDILGVKHAERHSALLRIEDINPMSLPANLKATLRTIESNNIPFAFGYVPFYVNPPLRIFEQMSDKPEVMDILHDYVSNRGTPVLHGDTHQYRGVTTDDYEFWDDLADRPVKRDSDVFARRRVEEAIKESVASGIYPLTWETPHYAASVTDYQEFKRIFSTTYERRQTGTHLGTDQLFPYPVIDLHGQYVIPEDLGYVEKGNPTAADIVAAANAAYVVRDGYASFFFHPFLNPKILRDLINGVEKAGFTFVPLSEFPNTVSDHGFLSTNVDGKFSVGGEGRFLTKTILSSTGRVKSEVTEDVLLNQKVDVPVSIDPGETFIAYRHSVKPLSFAEKIFRLAKGDVSIVNRRIESMIPANEVAETMSVQLLWDEQARGEENVDQHSFQATLQAIGYDVAKIEAKDLTDEALDRFSLLVVPAAAARRLSSDDTERIIKAVDGGIVVVTDGETPLSRALGFDIGGKVRVSHVENKLAPTEELRWPDQPLVSYIEHLSEDRDAVFFAEREDRKPLVVGREMGEGHVLYFAPYFDPLSGQGYSRFPGLPYLLLNEFHLHPLLKRNGADAYFDPGYRQNISIEQLAQYWRRYGIRSIHVGAWHFYDRYSYDYERLIKVAHENGILVYAWYEWPHVSEKFWGEHPRWREKNGLLADAHIDWRYLMNFQNPDCFKTVMDDSEKFLTKYEWDGVDVAEFHFESDDPGRSDHFTPLNNNARKAFEKTAGFDPIELWKDGSPHYWRTNPADLQSFYDFRKNVNTALFAKILKRLSSIPAVQQRKMEIVTTVFDVYGHPELTNRLGIDGPRTLALINKYDATLQVEDPAVDWARPPSRYVELGERYSKLNLKNPFAIDINVLAVHPPSQVGFAADTPSGTEILQLFQAASSHAPRVCLYSESTVAESDWEILPYSMAASATVERKGDEWVVRTPHTVRLELSRGIKRVLLDDRVWFCHDGRSILVAPGEHHISVQSSGRTWFDTSQLDTRLVGLTGELIGSEQKSYGLEVEYRSSGRCALMFSRQPYRVTIDGKGIAASTIKGADGYTVIAPPGQHRLRVISESGLLHFLGYISVVSASLIVLFGTASSGLLLLLFIFIKIHRKTQPVRRRIAGKVFRKKKRGTV
jgi:uncharacterized protein YdaL